MRQVPLDHRVPAVNQDLPDPPDLLDQLETEVKLDQLEPQAVKENAARPDLQAQLDLLAPLDNVVNQVNAVKPDLLDQLVQLDSVANLEQEENQEHLDHQDRLESEDRPDQLDPQDQLDLLDHQAHKDPLDNVENLGPEARLDLQDQQVYSCRFLVWDTNKYILFCVCCVTNYILQLFYILFSKYCVQRLKQLNKKVYMVHVLLKLNWSKSPLYNSL